MPKLSHVDANRRASMVDVGGKGVTRRSATAQAIVFLPEAVSCLFADGEIATPKGAVIQTAILAGTMAAKRTADLIPLCHVIPLDGVQIAVQFEPQRRALEIAATAKATHKTGVEMEALTAATVAALTVYDMCKALSPEISIGEIRLLEKTGGRRDYKAASGTTAKVLTGERCSEP